MAGLPPIQPFWRRLARRLKANGGTADCRQIAADLRASEGRFRALVDGSIQGILVHRKFVPLFANPAAAQMLGYATPEELLALGSLTRMLAPHERRRVRKLAEARLRGEDVPSRYEIQARRKDGSLVWLEIRSSVVEWDGRPAFQVAAVDIDERKQAETEREEVLARLETLVAERTGDLRAEAESRERTEAALRESEERFQALFDNSPQALNLKDADGRYLVVNTEWERQHAASRDEALGRTSREVFGPATGDRLAATEREVLATGQSHTFEATVTLPDGRTRTRLITKFPVRDRAGRVTRIGTVGVDISERKATEEALRRSEARFRDLLDNSPLTINLKDAEGRFLLVNRQFERQHGVVAENALGKTARELFGDASATAIEAADRQVIDTGRTAIFEVDFQLPDGSIHTHLGTKFPIRDAGGAISGFGTIGLDITERKRMEQAILEGQERFREFAESSSDWLWETDADSIVTFVSDRIRDLLDVEPADVVGRRRQSFAAPGQETVLDHLERTTAARKPIRDFRYDIVNRKGQRRWLSISGRPRYSPNGEFLGYRGTGTDITERVEAGHREAQVQERFLAAIETVPVAVALFDDNDRLVVSNARFRAQLATAGRLEPGTRFEDFCRAEVAAGSIVSARDVPEEWIRQRLARHRNPSGPFEVCRTNGWFQVREHRTADGDTLVVAHDITDRKRAEQALLAARDELEARVRQRTRALEQEVRDRQHAERALQEANQELEKRVEQRTRHLREEIAQRKKLEAQFVQAQKMEAVGQLAGGIAHDFNNLLMVIQGNLSWLSERLQPDDKTAHLMAMALEAARRAGELTHRVLAFSRRQDLRPERLDLRHVLANITPLAARALSEAVTFDVQMEEGLWPLMADPHQLESAILNVAINARDAMPGGGTFVLGAENRTVDAAQAERHEGTEPGEYVCLSMRDTGTGMPSEVVARAFEPFFTTKEVGKGSGLGLSMVFGFARQSGGFVELISQPGQGTTVDLYLPCCPGGPVPAAGGVPAAPPQVATGGLSVLVVEDDPLVRSVATEYLRMAGYKTHEAADGRSALDVMATTPDIDVVLSDIIMPGGLSGLDLADLIGQRWPATPVLLMSGYSYDEFARHGIDPDAADILRKPFTKRELVRKIEAALAASEPAGGRTPGG